jgi:hypothetical protein
MNGPRLVCGACNEPTTMFKPICDKCLRAVGVEPRPFCALCEVGLPVNDQGMHQTRTGGHAGRCEGVNNG